MTSHDVDDRVPGHWIVILRPYLSSTIQETHVSSVRSMTTDPSTTFHCEIAREFEFPEEVRGYSAQFGDETKRELENMDEMRRAKLPSTGPVVYQYKDNAAGLNTIAYILDTGINAEHDEFEGRATRGPKFVTSSTPISNIDVNGHGTHVAGTIASRSYGVAKKARVVSVKVFNDNPSPGALTSDIIKALDWVVRNARDRGMKAVVNMSLGGGLSIAMNRAVAATVKSGLVVCVAAGNSAVLAEDQSPASEPLAITLGATNRADQIATVSNYGKIVDILAPGEDILSTWIGSRTATRSLRGTSMASPHVVGVSCCLLSDPDWTSGRSNFDIMGELLIRAEKNKIAGLDTRERTIDALLQNSE